MSLNPGTRVGPYEIVALLGVGGMGAVYKARDQRLARDVAIKVVATGRGNDAALLARLEQEARTAASLNHPNIVAVFDVGTHDGAPYVVSELLDGETLRERLATGPLPLRKAIEYVTPHVLFEGSFVRGQPGLPGYDVSVDGRRFLMVKPDEAEATQRPIHIVINWFDELRRLTATPR